MAPACAPEPAPGAPIHFDLNHIDTATADAVPIATGSAHQHSCRFLFDSGALGVRALISAEFVKRARLQPRPLADSFQARLPGGQLCSITQYIPQLTVQLGGFRTVLPAVPILPALSTNCDILLGHSWLHSHRAVLDFSAGFAKLHDRRRRSFTIPFSTLGQQAPRPISRKALRKLLRHSEAELWAVEVNRVPEVNAELAHVSAEKSDLIDLITVPTLDKYTNEKMQHVIRVPASLSQRQRDDLKAAFSLPGLFEFPTAANTPVRPDADMDIVLDGPRPPAATARRVSPLQRELMKDVLADLLRHGHIRPSKSPFASPVLFAAKPGGGLRFCVDYRALNKVTRREHYPLPAIDELLDRLGQSRIFSSIDLYSSYHQLRVKQPEATAFITPLGQFEYTVVPFGLVNAPSAFSRFVAKTIADLPDTTLNYLDDVAVHSDTTDAHVQHLIKTLRCLHAAGLRLNARKCQFFAPELKYLGHVIRHGQLAPDPAAIRAVQEATKPTDVPSLRRFLGLTGWLRRFVHRYADRTAPLSDLLRGNATTWPPEAWTDRCDAAFTDLVSAITEAPTLLVADPSKPYTIISDWSTVALGGILCQLNADNKLQPVAYRSRKLQSRETRYPSWEGGALAIVDNLKFWRCYIHNGQQIRVLTDHHGLRTLLSLKQPNPRQARWVDAIAEFMPDIQYRPGTTTEMRAVDSLSRPSITYEINAISTSGDATTGPSNAPGAVGPSNAPGAAGPSNAGHQMAYLNLGADPSAEARVWAEQQEPSASDALQSIDVPDIDVLGNLRAAYATDVFLEEAATAEYVQHRDLFYTDSSRKQLVVACPTVRKHLLQLHHDVPYVGHRGRDATIELLQRHYFWPTLAADVAEYVRTCITCTQNRPLTSRPHGHLQPLPTPARRFETLAMDFLFHLPRTSRGNTGVLTVTDKLSRAVKLIPLQASVTAQQTAALFRKHVFSAGWGLQLRIVSDRDTRFLSNFWTDLMQLLGIRPALSSGYHPQTDGSSEAANKIALQVLRSFPAALGDRWDEFIDLIEFAMNNTVHRATGFSPFFLLHGCHPRTPLSQLHDDPPASDADALEFVRLQHAVLETARRRTFEAQSRMASAFDTARDPAPKFSIGDYCLLSSRPFSLSKTGHRWLGPFKVTEILTPTTVRLDIPAYWRIHPVWHSEHLQLLPQDQRQPASLPAPVLDQPLRIEAILSHRRDHGRYMLTVKYVDKPLGYPPNPISASHAQRYDSRLVADYLRRVEPAPISEGGSVAGEPANPA